MIKELIVAADGSGHFTNVQEAVDSVPEGNIQRVTIRIKKGIYKQKLFIEKPFIHLIGESVDETILTYDDSGLKKFPGGENMGTFNSYSTFVGADDFSAENITFENTAGRGDVVGQALAAYVDADRMRFRNCRFLGSQDTLFTGPLPPETILPNGFKGPREHAPRRMGRHYYENCFIQGDVDFIFGSAIAVFNRCEIFSNDRNAAVNGYITAASTPEGEEYGYVFIDCKLTGDAAPKTVYLGRPWRNYASVAFINCWMGEHIKTEGWHNWDKAGSERTVKFVEYNSSGPGGKPEGRISWSVQLSGEEVKAYSIERVLSGKDGWNPTHY